MVYKSLVSKQQKIFIKSLINKNLILKIKNNQEISKSKQEIAKGKELIKALLKAFAKHLSIC